MSAAKLVVATVLAVTALGISAVAGAADSPPGPGKSAADYPPGPGKSSAIGPEI